MSRALNKRDKAIMDWAKENRSELVRTLEQVIDSEGAFLPIFRPFRDLHIMLQIGFDAGRKFQRDNPEAPDDIDDDNFTCL